MSLDLETVETPHGPVETVKWADPNPYAVYMVRRAKAAIAAKHAPEHEPDLDSIALDDGPIPVTPEPLA